MMETTIKEMRTICLIFGLVAISIWAKAGSFYELSPPKDRIEGIEFPRNWSILYRGTTEGQLSLPDAISALFGQEEVNLESMFFSTIKKELMGESVSQGVELTSSLRQSIKKMIRQNQGFFNLKEASKITINLVDEVFENMLNDKKSLASRYLDYRSSEYLDWPKDVIFSTIISPAAATYGNRVVVIREKKVRSLDMNYWNHVHSDRWYTYTRDAGEFISYGYIPGSDLVGYQVRTGSKTPNCRISYAIYRAFDPKSKALLVLSGLRRDGSLSTCISQNPEDGFYYHCEYKEGTIITSIPGLSRERVRISGVLVLCGSDNNSENCSKLSDREEGFYRELQVELPGNVVTDLQNRIKNLDVQGKLVRFLGPKDFLHKN